MDPDSASATKCRLRLQRSLKVYEAAFGAIIERALSPQSQFGVCEPFAGILILHAEESGVHIIRVTPLSTQEGTRARAPSTTAAILCVHAAQAPSPPSEETLRQLLGLTPAETRVALALLAGNSARAVASHLQISENTVKTHIKGIYAKAGVRRLTDLLRLLFALHDA